MPDARLERTRKAYEDAKPAPKRDAFAAHFGPLLTWDWMEKTSREFLQTHPDFLREQEKP